MARTDVTERITGVSPKGKKILVVGAGGIGCELVKNLVLTGFDDITMIDLDTIDYSNLNRQFLFRAKHVGRSKAEVAREAVLDFPHDPMVIKAEHGNIKSIKYNLDFFRSFAIVLNALDNIDARRHVNRVCLAADVPLIESGTQGYLGQVRAILKGKSQCYECDPPPPPKTYPICTIRNHPDKPVHCISWAKDLLFKKLFGGEETDLVDASQGGEEGGGEEGAGDGAAGAAGGAGAAGPADGPPTPSPPLVRNDGESAEAFARRVFRVVFQDDVERLLRMSDLWKERAPPTPLRLDELELPSAAALAEVEQRVWTVAESASVFVDTIVRVLEKRADEVGGLSFDKDDADALDFVTSASNLRSTIFGIETKSRWDVKEIAGAIIPAIATTNAIIAGFIVLECLKVLANKPESCRYCVCNRNPSGKKRDMLLFGRALDEPSPKCMVCGTAALTLTLDTTKWTVGGLIDLVVKKHLSFNRPTIDAEALQGESDQICEGDDDQDDNERAKYAKYAALTLSALPQPIVSGTKLQITDFSQNLEVTLSVEHAELDPEEVPAGFTCSGAAPADEAPADEAPASEPPAEGGAKRSASDEGGGGTGKKARTEPAEPAEDDDGCVMLD